MTMRPVALLDPTARAAFGQVLAFQGIPDPGTLDGTQLAVVCGSGAGPVTTALDSGISLLVGADTLRVAHDALGEASGWLPFLPLRLASDVGAAHAALADGAVGQIDQVAITSYHGRPQPSGWQDDAVRPGTWFESAVWAVDLAEHLAGVTVMKTHWLRPPADAVPIAIHYLGDDVLATVRHLPYALGPGPAFSATVLGGGGQLLLRQPFAPGALAVWRSGTRDIVLPALPKQNQMGFGVSAPGGWEAHSLLQQLVEPGTDPVLDESDRARAIRIVRHLEDSLTDTS